MQPTIIGILGKPLAGKDTVAKALRERYTDLAVISMGDVINEVKATGPEHRFWPILKDSIAIADAGGIAPDEPIFECFRELADEYLNKGKTKIVWSAGPRTEEELKMLDRWAKTCGYQEQFFHIDITNDEAHQRLDGRKMGRADDRSDILSFRLAKFDEITQPVIDQLRNEGRIVEINGMGEKEIVGKRVQESLRIAPPDPEITLPAMARR
jgi:adenylate kinase family enzyme